LAETRTTPFRLKRLRAWQSFGYSYGYIRFPECGREVHSERNVVVATNATIIGHWIMMPPCPFSDLSERVRRENNWFSRNYHDIEWFDHEANLKYLTLQLRKITRQAGYIYTRGQEKVRYLRELVQKCI